MKKRILSLTMALVMALSLSLPAMAAEGETAGIAVQLNGANIEFTDAAPISKDNRTFLPARAVFEAMGAELAYDNATQTVTAKRDDVTLTMVVGSTDATITVAGVTLPLTMDVAPFIQSDRTYVPVRFAANAFGCNVGWDQDDQTVILIDTAKVAAEAMAKHEYTWIEKYTAYTAKFNAGKWAMDGSFKGDVALNANSILNLDATMKGLVDGEKSGQITMTMNMDMTGLMNLVAAMTGTTVEEMGVTAADMKQSITMDTRVNLETGVIYMLPDDNYCEMLGIEKGTWLSMDMSTMFASIDTADMLTSTTTLSADLNDKDTAYQNAVAELDKYCAAISDEGFKKVTGGYSATIDMVDGATTGSVTLVVSTNAKDEVTGYKMTATANADMSEMKDLLGADAVAQMAALGLNVDTLKLNMTTAMDSANKSTMELTIDLGNAASVKLSGDVKYTASTKTVETEPPAGSTVVDFFDLLYTSAEAAPAQPDVAPAA